MGLFQEHLGYLSTMRGVEDKMKKQFNLSEIRDGLVAGLVAGLFYGLVTGLVVGLVYGLVAGLVVGLVVGLVYGLVVGLVAGLVYGLVYGLVFGLVTQIIAYFTTGLIFSPFVFWSCLILLIIVQVIGWMCVGKLSKEEEN